MWSPTRWRRSTSRPSAAAQLPGERPEAAAEALQTIQAASKDGLRELRAILNVLRRADEAEPTQPTPGLAQLGPLTGRARRAGGGPQSA